MIHIGIDPGLTGAIVALLPSGEIEFHDMPVLETPARLCGPCSHPQAIPGPWRVYGLH